MQIKPFTELDEGDLELKRALNYNPWLTEYTLSQPESGRNPYETDRGGWRGYNRVYSKYLSAKKEQPLRILEIGVHSGYGLLSWASYFKNATVFGIELDSSWVTSNHKLLTKYEDYSRVNIKYFDSRDVNSWKSEITGKFDVIIDDGSHKPADQLVTLEIAFKYLSPTGIYFIEDISSRYHNPSMDIVWNRLKQLETNNYVAGYSHKNEGWEKLLLNKSVWSRYGITEETPKIAEDYIAVIKPN